MTKDKKVFTIGEFEISSDGTQWILKTTYKKWILKLENTQMKIY